jgi:hypothetical protein
MFFEVSSLTYHIPITIDSLIYDACVGTALRLSLCLSIRLDRYSRSKEGPLVRSRSQPPPPRSEKSAQGDGPSIACVYNGLLNRCVACRLPALSWVAPSKSPSFDRATTTEIGRRADSQMLPNFVTVPRSRTGRTTQRKPRRAFRTLLKPNESRSRWLHRAVVIGRGTSMAHVSRICPDGSRIPAGTQRQEPSRNWHSATIRAKPPLLSSCVEPSRTKG